MQIDPTRWLVSFAGFVYDWIITREWTRILLSLIPVALLLTVVGLVWWGKSLNRRQLAGWYRQLGDAEIAEWENSWAGATERQESDGKASPSQEATEEKEVSRYAEMLFRRVQLLDPSEHSQFVIGATMAQRGAMTQAQTMLGKVAPDDRRGYPPAHAYLARLYLNEFRKEPTPEMAERLKHHISQAKRWERVPRDILRAGSDLYWIMGDPQESIRLLSQAAESDPAINLELSKRAKAGQNMLVYDQSFPRAEKHFQEQLRENPKNDVARVQLAELYASANKLDEAESILREDDKLEMTPTIARGLSEVYRLRFRNSFVEVDGNFSANVPLLEMALRFDSTNPLVAEEIARLARLPGPQASQAMVDKLYEFLTEGKATAATHAWLAESFLIRNDYAKALPHLEQVVIRLPNAAQYLNNLAYVIADLHPERMEEALGYAQRSVTSAASTRSPNADFYDTLGLILSKLDRDKEAVAAYETAIELQPQNKLFHQSIAVVYQKLDNSVMAQNHEKAVANIESKERAAAAAAAEAQPSSSEPPEATESAPPGEPPVANDHQSAESESTPDQAQQE